MFFSDQKVIILPKKNFENLSTRSFEFKIRGQKYQGFVVKKDDKYFAYHNLCQHLPVTLDLRDNHFFTHDKSALQCHMHGAIYEIESGLCTAGPCQGASLKSLPVREEETRIVIELSEIPTR